MSKDEWSLLISVIAIGLSGTSLGWNIYRDVILKPRVKVKAGIHGLFGIGDVGSRPLMKLLVTAVNFGPGDVFCKAVVAKNAPMWKRLTRKVEHWFVIHESPKLPQKLEVGQPLDVLIPYEKEGLLAKHLTHIGVTDSFGRTHWAKGREVKKALAQYRKDYGAVQ